MIAKKKAFSHRVFVIVARVYGKCIKDIGGNMSKAQRTKSLEIPQEVKKAVAERDSIDGHPCCIWCGKPAPTTNPLAFSNAHFVSRGQGGLGIEENILTLCWECHLKFDQSTSRQKMKAVFSEYLKTKYSDWNEDKLIYRKEQEI
jgi:hypothetical protein